MADKSKDVTFLEGTLNNEDDSEPLSMSIYNPGLGPYGIEACDTLVAGMTSESFQDVVVVVAGYPQAIDEMLNKNAGPKSRFTHFFHFPDWEPEDCSEFLLLQATKENFVIEPGALEEFRRGCAPFETIARVRKWTGREKTMGRSQEPSRFQGLRCQRSDQVNPDWGLEGGSVVNGSS